MKLLFILCMSLLLVGCNEKVIKMKPAVYDIQCEGLERTSVKNPVITIGENIVIRYEKPYGEGVIIASKCRIE